MIKKASFRIKMPKEFDGSKAGLSIGRKGKAGFDGGAAFRVVDNSIIEGYMERELASGEGITFRTEVPDGYFSRYFPYSDAIAISISAVLAFAAFLIWLKYGKDEHITPVVSFELPKGLNAIQAEFAYKGHASEKGLAALLIELANKGNVSIDNADYSFTLSKLSPCEKDTIEQKFLDAIFYKSDKVSKKDLEKSHYYYIKSSQIRTSVNCDDKMIYDMKTKEGIIPHTVLWIIAVIFLIGVFAFADFSFRGFFAGWLLSIVSLALFLIAPLFFDEWNILTGIWMAGTGIALIVFVIMGDGSSYENINTALAIFLLDIAAMACAHYLPKRSPQGRQYLGELLGLKKFIQTAELPELEAMAEANPRQFYDILPYAYILGVSDVWTKKLDNFLRTHPIEEKPRYNVRNIDSFADKVYYLSQASESNGGISSSSSGSGSSRSYSRSSSGGGGRVGGGGGGGGGRSW